MAAAVIKRQGGREDRHITLRRDTREGQGHLWLFAHAGPFRHTIYMADVAE
jgi:hypothetical protein